MDSKKKYIKALEIASSTIDEANGNNGEDVYFTYFTSFGKVQGKIKKIDEIVAESDVDFRAELEKMIKTSGLNTYSLAEYAFKKDDKSLQHSAIYLEDVVIDTDKERFNSNTFVLFADQVVGIIPGKIIV
ncbi:hypothetical protein P4U97_21080 [Bacillus swezeyi]|uniref:hypothetical protein n=1 Tax=Bacillus swezeyi TaxID=1925020 RepID=UPI002E22AEF5|nr:hypothetical protein [Bacillus swezeyi]